VVGKPEVIRLLPHRSSTGSNRDHFLQADFRVLIRTVPILDYFRIADYSGVERDIRKHQGVYHTDSEPFTPLLVTLLCRPRNAPELQRRRGPS